MKKDYELFQITFEALDAVSAATLAAQTATAYHAMNPDSRTGIDTSYWACRDAIATCNAADAALESEPQTDGLVFLRNCIQEARDRALDAEDELLTLADALGLIFLRVPA